MVRTYSLATLMLVMAIVAVAVAGIRMLFVRIWNGEPDVIVVPMIAGAIAGAVFSVALVLWHGAAWGWVIPGLIGGIGLGAAAGAQTTAPVGWSVVLLAPLIVIGSAALVAANRRRQIQLLALKSPPAESRPFDPIQSAEPQFKPGAPDEPLLADETS